MLVLSLERLLPLDVNTVILSKDGYYFYTDRATYEASVLLTNKFSLEEMMEEVERVSNTENIQWLFDLLPKPISILAPFIGIIESEFEQDIEECVKALHVITNAISPYRYLGVRKEMRKSVTFSLSVLDEAELTTESFLSNTFDLEKVKELFSNPQPMQMMYPNPYQQVPVGNFSYPEQQQYPQQQYQEQQQQAPVQESFGELDLETAGVEELRAHPDWEECGPGVFYNNVTGDTAFVDVPEDDAFVEDVLSSFSNEEDDKEEGEVADTVASSGREAPQEVSKEETNKVTDLLLY